MWWLNPQYFAVVDWRDFYSQNFTPVATHFAIYPIIEFAIPTGVQNQFAEKNGLKIRPPFPNPSANRVTIGFNLSAPSPITIDIMDMKGKLLRSIDKGLLFAGENSDLIDLADFPKGNYIFIVKSDQSSLAGKFTII